MQHKFISAFTERTTGTIRLSRAQLCQLIALGRCDVDIAGKPFVFHLKQAWSGPDTASFQLLCTHDERLIGYCFMQLKGVTVWLVNNMAGTYAKQYDWQGSVDRPIFERIAYHNFSCSDALLVEDDLRNRNKGPHKGFGRLILTTALLVAADLYPYAEKLLVHISDLSIPFYEKVFELTEHQRFCIGEGYTTITLKLEKVLRDLRKTVTVRMDPE